MAQREDLTLNVKVKGADDVEKLADSLEDVESASEQARKALMQVAQTADTELRSAAQAAEALGRALGPEMASKMDLDQVVIDLNKMGVSFDEIRLEAEQFATTLKQVDDIKLSQTTDGLDTMRSKLDTVRSTSDNTRSVLANMAGNTAQDLGEIGGVAGSAGVLIGQLAEYATEGNISLKNLAALAAPMAGLVAVSLGVSEAMKGIAESKAFDKAQMDGYADALGSVNDEYTAAISALQEMDSLKIDLDPKPFEIFADQTADITATLAQYGITVGDVAAYLSGTTQQQQAFLDVINASITDTGDYAAVIEFLSQQLDYFGNAQQLAGDTTEVFASSLESANTALQGVNETQGQVTDAWAAVIDDMERNGQITDASIGSWQQLRDELQLTDAAMAELVDEKLAEKTEEDTAALQEEAAALQEAADAALELQQAVADLGDTMASIDSDDFANISGALEGELNKVDDIYSGLKFDVDFQPALDEALDGLESFGPDLQTLADEWANILTGKPIDIFGNVRADDAEFQAKMGELTNLFQEGVVNAFDQGGVEAANTFVQSTAAQIAASTGLSIAEVYRIMGLPPDGSVDALIKPSVDAEAAADAMAILDALIGVDPNNPILAHMRLAVQTGDIPPQIAEIAARILAGEALGVPAKLEEFTQADIDAAYALIAQQEVTVPTAVDPSGAEDGISDIEQGDYQATVTALADTQLAARQLLDETTRQRQATIYAIAAITSAKAALDSLRERRTASILAVAYTEGAEYELNQTARRRDSYIYQHVVPVGGGGGGGGGGIPGAGTLAAPAAGPALMTAPMTTDGEIVGTPSPMSVPSSGVAVVSTAPSSVVNNMQVTVQAAVIGNRHEVERTVAKALRSYTRLNGSRN